VAVGNAPAAEQSDNAADLAACNALISDPGLGGLDGGCTSSVARGGVVREPANSADTEIPAGSVPKVSKGFSVTVPVYFHVITQGNSEADGNVSQQMVRNQVDVLNRTYNAYYGGSDTAFNFKLIDTDRTRNADWFNMGYGSRAERAAKAALHRGGVNALNIYPVEGAGFLGWATFPKDAHSQVWMDGVVVASGSLPGGLIDRFNLGFTATHDAGHWLGLYHTFQNGCSTEGDGVDDTPAQRFPTSGCPEGQDSCPTDPGLDPIHNYMDYSDDPCYTEFTRDQSTRMSQQWLFYRAQ